MDSLQVVTVCLGSIIFILGIVGGVVSFREHEKRAGIILVVAGVIISAPFFLVALLSLPGSEYVAATLLTISAIALIVFVLPQGKQTPRSTSSELRRVDERDIMFARKDLVVGSEQYETYYALHPDKKSGDDRFRSKPGLLKKGAIYYNQYGFAAADASFAVTKNITALVSGEPATVRVPTDPRTNSMFLQSWAKHLGAVSVGFCELKSHHLYSHGGRGERYGEEYTKDHKHAIAITVGMDREMLDSAPRAPIVMESARQYLSGGIIAVQIAEWIRAMGYPARAHIDGNYQVVCPLVARDAGLGEVGRMGLLMTPELGPRVRLAVVTTDLPLIVDEPFGDNSVIDFCRMCVKCAEVCPSQAIPLGDREEHDSVHRWKIHSESCFGYWCTIGTDCGRCVSVCPYSHPNSFMHNVVRSGIRRNSMFRWLAVKLDDILYGRRPASKPLPDWLPQ